MSMLVRIFGILLLVGVQCLGIYWSILKPLYDSSRPGSSHVRRWVSSFVTGCFQFLLQVVCAGPLQLLFLGQDPFGLISTIQWTIRHMDATRLNIRPPLFQVNVRGRSITIPLRNGEETSATLYSPRMADGSCDDETPRPVILVRTPYDKRSCTPWGVRFAERGYHFVAQDTRGRFGSTGDFFPMKNEAEDGAATIEWLEKQPWCNGSVGMTGISYLGLAAWAAMREQIGALKAVAPILAATDLYNVMYGRGDSGAAHIELMFRWSYLVIHLMNKRFGMLEAIFTFFMGTGRALKSAYMHAPLKEADTKFLCPNCEEPLEWFQGGFDHPLETEPFWQDKRKLVDVSQMTTVPPVLLFAGWYDFFCSEQLHDFTQVSRLNPECRLVVGPYTHWHVIAMQPKMFRSLIDFFDRHLLKDPTSKQLSPVEVFSMGHDMGWRQLESWPPPNCLTQKYMFAQENDHNLILLRMDHAQQNTRKESEVSYTYNPANPTPQIGGATFNPSNCGRLAQNEIEESGRDDILVFTSKPIVDHPMTIAGEMKVRLMVESNVEGTDYVARVCHVTPNNISQNIAEGIVRRFDLQLGKRTCIEITLSPVMNQLAIGDRLRIQICSSSYPKYGRHLNTRESFHLEVERNAMLSKQRLILGGTNGCHVLIPFLS